MHPELIDLGFISIHSYGFFIASGFIICLILMRRKAQAASYDKDLIADIALWTMVAGLLGARVLYIFTRLDDFMQNPSAIFKFWEGGLVFYGGFISGMATYVYLSHRHKVPILNFLDIAAPSVAIAHFFGRLGCFAAGCCFGSQVDHDHPLAVVFTHPESIAPTNVPLHPAQLYDAANTLILFVLLQLLYARRKFPGQVTAVYLMLYAIGRSIVEIYRGDNIRGFVVDEILSTSQFIAIWLFIGAALLYWWANRKKTSSA